MDITGTRDRLIKWYYSVVEKCVQPLINVGVSPDVISVIALFLSLISAIFYANGAIFIGGIFLLLSGFMDTIDGSVARLLGKLTRFGALLDSTLDRYAEFFIFFGLLVYFRSGWMFYVVLLALMGSIMVSYVKARAQSLGKTRVVGMMQRPERFALLVAGSLLNAPFEVYYPEYPNCFFMTSLILLAILANATAIYRLFEAKKDLEGKLYTLP